MLSIRIRAVLVFSLAAVACDSGSTAPPPPDSIQIVPAETTLVALGASVTLTASAYDASGRPATAGTVSWSSSAPGVAVVDGGRVTAVAPGDATITAAAGTLSAQAHVAVRQIASAIALTLPHGGAVRAFGSLGRATAVVSDANGHIVPGAPVTWKSSDTSVVAVTAVGDLVARRNGQATIVANAGGLSSSAGLTVDVRGAVRVTLTVSGNARDPDGYLLVVDSTPFVLHGDSSFVVDDLREGVHPVSLGGVATHCTIVGTDRQGMVAVPATTVQVGFTVRCLGRFAYVAGSEVHYVDDVGTDRAITPSLGNLQSLNWSPDGSRLAFVGGPMNARHVYVVRPDGSEITQLTNGVGGEAWPTWSPTGDRIAFTAPGTPPQAGSFANALYVMSADGSNVRQLLEANAWYQYPQWMPDGRRLVVNYLSGLYLVDVQTGVPQVIPAAAGGGWNPVVSPDGKSLAFELMLANVQTIVVMPVGSSTVVPVSTGAGVSSLLAQWFPDGKSLLFMSSVNGRYFQIFRAGANGSGLENLTRSSSDEQSPAISPDGHFILFQSARSGGYRIYAMNADGSLVTPIISGLGYAPSWRP